MKKILAVIVMAALLPISPANATRPAEKGSTHFRYGLEWGYTATVLNSYHYNYVDPVDGYRVFKDATELFYFSNAHVQAVFEYDFWNHFSASFLAGWAGVKQERRIVPITIRGAYYFRSYDSDSAFAFAEGGWGFHKGSEVISYLGKIGGGYRIALNDKNCLEFLASFQICSDHPDIFSPSISDIVSDADMRRSDAIYGAINLTAALKF